MIPLFKVHMPESVIDPLRDTLLSGFIGEGEKVVEFEEALAPWFDNENVLATNNGTAAIQLALRLSGVGPGDEVISTPMTCSATNEPVLAAGAKIVWADIDPWTGNIDVHDVKKKITPKTKAIICVDWGGYPCTFAELNYLAKKNGLKLIEDACHAFGSEYYGDKVGCQCDFSCFSFQAIKTITTVDGGALTCRSKEDYEKGKLLRWYGIDRTAKSADLRCENDITDWGYKFHMNDVTATIGLEQLNYVGDNLALHAKNAECYSDLPCTMRYQNGLKSANWLFTIRVKNRDDFIEWMKTKEIATSKVHVRNDKYTIFSASVADLPGVDEFYSEHVCIPVGWWVKDAQYIKNAVEKWLKK